MNKENKNKILLVSVVILLLIFIVIYSFCTTMKKGDVANKLNINIKQIYSSDYELHLLNNEYYFGTYDNKLNVFIDLNGKEVYKTNELISYENYYKMSDGRYLFYNNDNNKLNIYVFDGSSLNLYYSFDNASYVKPIVFKDIIIGFTSFIDNKLYLYNLNSEGINVLINQTIVADKFIDNIFYINNKNALVIKTIDDLYGVINVNGDIILEAKYKDIISLSEDGKFIVKNDDNKYGIIDKNGNVLLDHKYDGILEYNNYYIVIKDNKMALFDKDYNQIIGFKMNYNTLMGFNYRSGLSVELYDNEDYVVIINNLDEDKYKREYEYHNMYVIKDNDIIKNINQINYNNELKYSYDKDYNISFYNELYEEINKFKIDKINKIDSVEYLSIDKLEIKYLNSDNKEVIECYDNNGNVIDKCNKVVLSNSLYYGIVKDNYLILYDYDNNELNKVSGNVLNINKDYVVIDNALYIITVE